MRVLRPGLVFFLFVLLPAAFARTAQAVEETWPEWCQVSCRPDSWGKKIYSWEEVHGVYTVRFYSQAADCRAQFNDGAHTYSSVSGVEIYRNGQLVYSRKGGGYQLSVFKPQVGGNQIRIPIGTDLDSNGQPNLVLMEWPLYSYGCGFHWLIFDIGFNFRKTGEIEACMGESEIADFDNDGVFEVKMKPRPGGGASDDALIIESKDGEYGTHRHSNWDPCAGK